MTQDKPGENRDIAAEHELFAFDDAAYVLGSLDETAEGAFTEHLGRCLRCQAQVAELRGMPQILMKADPAAWQSADTAVPASLLPSLLRSVSVDRRRRRIRTGLTGLVAACIVAALAIVGSAIWSDAHEAHSQALHAANGAIGPVIADVTLTGLHTGTRVQMRCVQLGGGNYPAATDDRMYHMVIFNRAGDRRVLSSWVANPDYTVQALSQWPKSAIAKIEIDDDQGQPLLAANF